MPIFKKKDRSMVVGARVSPALDMGAENQLYATDGLMGIKIVSDPSNATFDVVLVHGLTGNREKTWTHPNGTFWPSNLLSHDLPCARIMTFGYDADVVRFWTIASSNNLDDHGKSLAYALLDQQVDRRPIVFVAHSLGGLVCENALNLSSKRPALKSIMRNTLGIIFMGTPHGGSHLANWGETVAKYANIFRGTNRDILRNLQPGSSDLLRTEEDFQHMLRQDVIRLKIYCFYEALKMNDTIGKVVVTESAILPGYDNCSINANHRTMTKFSGRTDAGYGQVLGVMQRWIKEMECQTKNINEKASRATVGAISEGPGEATGEGAGELTNTVPNTAAGTYESAQYSGPVFNGSVSARNLIAGTQNNNGGTLTFNFS